MLGALPAAIAVAVLPDSVEAAGCQVALLGDSMTWIGGDSCQNETGWSHYLRESAPEVRIEVFARSGATWTNTSKTRRDAAFYSEKLHDDNVVYNQALRLTRRVKDGTTLPPDLAIIFAGANDAWFADRRPGIFTLTDSVATYAADVPPADATTLQKSVALVCDMLHETLPGCELVLVAPLEMSKVAPELTARVADIIESAGRSRGVSTLRADREVAIRHEQESRRPTFTYDGVHTNPQGAAMTGNYILQSIKKHKDYKDLKCINDPKDPSQKSEN